jgi:hypothetical protein
LPTTIEDDLPQPAGVALQHVRDVRSDVIGKLQPLRVGSDGHGLQGVTETIAQQKLDRLEVEFPASIFEKSRMSLMIMSSASADVLTPVRYSVARP